MKIEENFTFFCGWAWPMVTHIELMQGSVKSVAKLPVMQSLKYINKREAITAILPDDSVQESTT